MKNEALCKLLAYNITCVIHSQCELGIEPFFRPKLEGEERNLLPLVRLRRPYAKRDSGFLR
jgi:hypothetical protein